MAVKASVTITISKYRDTDSITRYYKLQASTASAPAKPTTLTPSGWTNTEPTYTSGSTNTLYIVDKYVFSDGTFQYTEVSKSTSYEAAKEAYNKAQAAQDNIDNLEIGGRNYLTGTSSEWSNWIVPGTGTNKTFTIGSFDLSILNLKANDPIALQIELETTGFTSITKLYTQGAVNQAWSGDNFFSNPWNNIFALTDINKMNKVECFTKIFVVPQSTIDKINNIGGLIRFRF